MAKDLLMDRFGRFYEIPKMLALCGHHVVCVCLKYWCKPIEESCSTSYFDKVEWRSFALGSNWLAGIVRHYRRVEDLTASFKPDVIVGASDSIHVIMAALLSTKLEVPLVVDLYDNFESYRLARVPVINAIFKRAITKASAISVVSENLAAKAKHEYKPAGVVCTITNAICPEIFYPADKRLARRRLALPEHGLLIGTAGALTRDRGVRALYAGFKKLSQTMDNLYLVVAGRTDRHSRIPDHQRILYLGELPHARIGQLFNSLDIGVICNRKSAFSAYCFPQKLYEMLACGLPLVAANVGEIKNVLINSDAFLYDPEMPDTLADAVNRQLKARYVPRVRIPTWKDQGILFDQLIAHAAGPRRNNS